jgi:hypothetical protein
VTAADPIPLDCAADLDGDVARIVVVASLPDIYNRRRGVSEMGKKDDRKSQQAKSYLTWK